MDKIKIGTMAMEQDAYVVQFEYQDNYLTLVERGFQTKHYAPEWPIVWLPTGILVTITTLLTFMWLYMRSVLRHAEGLIE